MTETDHTVGIVGGGITGLALTHQLAEKGIDSHTFEASDEPGGVIQSRTVDGHVLEVGPQRMRKTPGVASLAKAVGLADKMIEARTERLYVYADGTLGQAPLSVEAFLSTDLLSWQAKLRMLAEPLTRDGLKEETAAQLFVRKFGQEAYQKFVGPLYGGIYGSDPAAMPAAYALEGLLKREQEKGSLLQAFRDRIGGSDSAPPVSFEGGNQRLPEAIYEQYDDRISVETPVRAIEPVGTGTDGPYRIETPDETRRVDQVVVTTPANVTAELLGEIATGARRLAKLQYNPLALVFLDAPHDRQGKGYQVGYGESLHTLGVSWNGQMFGRSGVQTVFLGGMHEPALLAESDDRLGTIARSEFEQVMGVDGSVIDVKRLDPGFPAWDQSWWHLEAVETPDSVWLATNYTARMGIPSRVREASKIATQIAKQTTAGTEQAVPG